MDVVPTATVMALHHLQEQGFWLCLISYRGAEKDLEVRSQRHFVFDQVRFVRSHLGKRGKAYLCVQLHGVGEADICEEALSKGILVCPEKILDNRVRVASKLQAFCLLLKLSCQTDFKLIQRPREGLFRGLC